MKLILAILRISKMQDTKKALEDAGLPSFTVMSVIGRGRGHGDLEKSHMCAPEHRELITAVPRLKSKRMITLIVTDEKKGAAIDAIMKVNHSGESGDGKIFVIDAIDSVRIRTGENGDTTLD